MTKHILRIDASASADTSVTRKLTEQTVAHLAPETVTVRDLARDPLPHLDTDFLTAQAAGDGALSAEQEARLALSDQLIAEIEAADTLVIGVPIYNFSIPSPLKAWIDLTARAGVTFRYTEAGPEGLLKGKRAVLVVASGGTPVGSDMDFATGYLRFVLGFIGITDVTIVAADQLAVAGDASRAKAAREIEALAA